MAKQNFTEMAKVQLSKVKQLVISRTSNGGFCLAQRLEVEDKEDDRVVGIFLKNAIPIKDIDKLIEIRDVLNAIINEVVDAEDDWE